MGDDPKKVELWTPDQKIPEQVRKMAFLFFLECYKQHIAKGDDWIPDDEYRDCISVAQVIHRIDKENEPRV